MGSGGSSGSGGRSDNYGSTAFGGNSSNYSSGIYWNNNGSTSSSGSSGGSESNSRDRCVSIGIKTERGMEWSRFCTPESANIESNYRGSDSGSNGTSAITNSIQTTNNTNQNNNNSNNNSNRIEPSSNNQTDIEEHEKDKITNEQVEAVKGILMVYQNLFIDKDGQASEIAKKIFEKHKTNKINIKTDNQLVKQFASMYELMIDETGFSRIETQSSSDPSDFESPLRFKVSGKPSNRKRKFEEIEDNNPDPNANKKPKIDKNPNDESNVDKLYVIRRKLDNVPFKAGVVAHSGLLLKTHSNKYYILEYGTEKDPNKVVLREIDEIKADDKQFIDNINTWTKQRDGVSLSKQYDINEIKEIMQNIVEEKDYDAINWNCHMAQENTRRKLGFVINKAYN